jgi:hypothetical protein
MKGVRAVTEAGDFEQFVACRSAVLLRTAYLLRAGDRGAAEDLLPEVLDTRAGTMVLDRDQVVRALGALPVR